VKYFVIGDEDTVLGLGMAGVEGRIVNDVQEADLALSAALADTDIGIILITERCADFVREKVDRYLFTSAFPLIVEIADRKGALPGRPGIREMVNKAIGIKL